MNSHEKSRALEERTVVFSSKLITFCKSLPHDNVLKPLVNQLVRSGTSIGANYAEANNASSRNDFRNKIYICKKESQETRYWLRLLVPHLSPVQQIVAVELLDEAQAFSLLFQKVVSSLQKNIK